MTSLSETLTVPDQSDMEKGHPRSSILVLIDSKYATSYYSLIVNLDISDAVFEIMMHLMMS